MEKIAVIGAGLIGRSWAIVFARAGHEVTVYDLFEEALAPSRETMRGNLDDLAKIGLLAEAPETVAARVRFTSSLPEALDGADYVQESALERLDVKKSVFADLDRLTPPETILASSASFAPVTSFASDLPGRARCIVAHPVNPPYLVPVVELVPAPFTDEAVVERTHALMTKVKQKPVIIRKETYGFVLNRLQAALLNEAFRLIEDGVTTPAELDITVSDGLGLRWSFMGPFETIDLNAPGGVGDYTERAKGPFRRLAEEQSDVREWSPAFLEAILQAARAERPEAMLGPLQDWRDRRLMALAAHKQTAETEFKKTSN
ncbi:3-hydroxyacyl-CoA dehydrogenase [Acuticoccus sp. M5D2P5]|uniref:3-hydroxyacyl-CoA dehydrogenase n=1 Tax=Acuticoccus kalidii TaxID=2910977 RepID=UPI001F175ABB|nr:3-hydroxyacyl-CoA dehydrogenase [Acuticoccus kalidii]MCF3935192.1 3-hydroxyacyl-CoA dehydrogenase [Acuticoccus kalidii]